MSAIDRILDLAAMERGDIPDTALAMARLSLFDWLACGLAGVNEPLAEKLRELAAAEGGRACATLFGGGRVPARMAALVNGATSHALDYDDTHFAHVGHPSVAIYPAAMAVAEERGLSGAALAEAFLIGAEASVRIGLALGAAHYNRGFHQTATAGAFGATVAAGRLMGLSRDAMRVAIGLCATRASGLKSQFGTMGKPYNAGIAASNGVECATLAALGFTSCDDGLMAPQGFVATHSDTPDGDAISSAPPQTRFLFEDIKYKLHACCHGTHAMIEALARARREEGVGFGDVAAFRLRTNPRWLSVCDIAHPRTGLEVKFSYRWLAGMTLRGDETASDKAYRDALSADPELIAFGEKVTVAGDDSVSDMQADGVLVLSNGREVAVSHDLAAPIPPDILEAGLRTKAAALVGVRGEHLWRAVSGLDDIGARDLARTIAN